MRIAIITAGIVTNIVEAPADYTAPSGSEAVPVGIDEAYIGFGYSPGTGFEQPPVNLADPVTEALHELKALDAMSVRSMREFLLANHPGDLLLAPLDGHETAAQAARGRLKP
jgi:hypothetical protein